MHSIILRICIFESIVSIEIAIKSVINNVMVRHYGTHWYLNKANFKSAFVISKGIGMVSQYDQFILKLEEECNNHKKNREESFIKKYCSYYSEPHLPPSWMMLDILSFGRTSVIFENILPTKARTEIARFFNTHDNILQSWLRAISYVRNLCAHHARIVYRPLIMMPLVPRKKDNIFLLESDKIDPSRIYYMLCCIQYLLNSIKASYNLKDYILEVSSGFPSINFEKIGFTPGWKNESIWN